VSAYDGIAQANGIVLMAIDIKTGHVYEYVDGIVLTMLTR
jgi:hypothetical protein